jgi:3',5'-cyclic-nucleotide phosphodiesterase
VGHSAKEINLHKIWSRKVTEEFWNQGDHEAQLKIPVTQLCERKINIAKSQDGFLSYVALELFESFGTFYQKYISQECFDKYNQVCIQQLKKNKEYWLKLIEKGEDGNKEFLLETDPWIRNFKHTSLPLETLTNMPQAN